MYDTNTDIPEENKLLLRDLGQAAKTLLDVGAKEDYAVGMFELALIREALKRTGNNRMHAAKLLGVHRNTLTRKLPVSERACRERYETVDRQYRALRA